MATQEEDCALIQHTIYTKSGAFEAMSTTTATYVKSSSYPKGWHIVEKMGAVWSMCSCRGFKYSKAVLPTDRCPHIDVAIICEAVEQERVDKLPVT